MIELDGTPNEEAARRQRDPRRVARGRAGARRRAARQAALRATSAGAAARVLPVPMLNILNGGAHADNTVDLQGVHGDAGRRAAVRDALRMGAEIFHAPAAPCLRGAGFRPGVGDEGGFAPEPRRRTRRRSRPSWEAIKAAGYRAGTQVADRDRRAPRASSGRTDGYVFRKSGAPRLAARPRWSSSTRTGSSAIRSCRSRTAWPRTTGTAGGCSPTRSGAEVQLVGDDLFVTNPVRLRQGHRSRGRQLDPHQSEPDRDTHRDALRRSPSRVPPATRPVISHRSGETEDATDRRPRRRGERRTDQDRQPRAAASEPAKYKPAASHRRGARATRHRHPGAKAFTFNDRRRDRTAAVAATFLSNFDAICRI